MRFQPAEMLGRLPEQFFARLVGKVAAKIRAGYDVINLGQGNPDLPTPPHIVEALKKAADKPKLHRYSPFRGYGFLREAVAEFYRREYGVTLDPEREVAVLFGAKAGLVEISQCFLNPGDLALVPDPGYPDYWSGIAIANDLVRRVGVRPWRMSAEDYLALPARLPLQGPRTEAAWDGELAAAMAHRGLAVHEEAALPGLLHSLPT